MRKRNSEARHYVNGKPKVAFVREGTDVYVIMRGRSYRHWFCSEYSMSEVVRGNVALLLAINVLDGTDREIPGVGRILYDSMTDGIWVYLDAK